MSTYTTTFSTPALREIAEVLTGAGSIDGINYLGRISYSIEATSREHAAAKLDEVRRELTSSYANSDFTPPRREDGLEEVHLLVTVQGADNPDEAARYVVAALEVGDEDPELARCITSVSFESGRDWVHCQ